MRLRLLFGVIVAVIVGDGACSARVVKCDAAPHHGFAWPTFGGANDRLGWTDAETALTPAAVASGSFGPIWSSSPFDSAVVGAKSYAGRMYASPLYADDVSIRSAAFDGSFDVLFAATTNGDVYAINAFDASCSDGNVPAGTTLWSASIATPALVPGLDGGSALGILSTPVFDATTERLYVAAMDASGGAPVWKLWALDTAAGTAIPGFPITLDAAAIEPVDQNGPCSFEPDATQVSQRAALALDAASGHVYVAFGGYVDTVPGWILAMDTSNARVAASFCAGSNSPIGQANGGMWGAGGPAVDDDGTVFMTTGNGPPGFGPTGVPHTWGDSLLALDSDLMLRGTYSPWNYCVSDANDADVGGDTPALLPDPRLVAFGSKQGNVYLLERGGLPGSVTSRPPCDPSQSWENAATDTSLLPPSGPPYCDPASPTNCVAGPLNVFGPYSDAPGTNEDNSAKMRSTPAVFSDGQTNYLFVAGSSKAADGVTSAPPSLAKLRLNTSSGQGAYLSVEVSNADVTLINPGSPVVTSAGATGAIVWVVDENGRRTDSLVAAGAPRPALFAFDGVTLQLLYRSGPTDLDVGGKYVEPVIAHGTVFVGTDRIQAFALRN